MPILSGVFMTRIFAQKTFCLRSKQSRMQILLPHRFDVERRRERFEAPVARDDRVDDSRNAIERTREHCVGICLTDRHQAHRRRDCRGKPRVCERLDGVTPLNARVGAHGGEREWQPFDSPSFERWLRAALRAG
jgi:hypothetical protein